MEEEATQPGKSSRSRSLKRSLRSSACTPKSPPRSPFRSPSPEIPDSQESRESFEYQDESKRWPSPEIPDSQESFEYQDEIKRLSSPEIPDSQESQESFEYLDEAKRSPSPEIPDSQESQDSLECQDEPEVDVYESIATQPCTDPRRLGQHVSDLDDDDLADIFCILHPASQPAFKAAALIAESTPQYTVPITSAEVKIKEGKGAKTIDYATGSTCDIALRLSADLINPLGGHCFGRNPTRCDFVMGHNDIIKRVSNVHFRIYINEHGIIMLEDQSTNGTGVDGHLLRAKEKNKGWDYRHTLQHGSIITITTTPPEADYKFFVRIPQRDDDDDGAYQANLTDYFLRQKNYFARMKMEAGETNDEPDEPPNLFATSNSISRVKEWKGGQKYNKVGIIGRGAFAVVYQITSKFDGVPFAAKELEKRRFMKNGILDQKVDSEMKIMRKIKHPNVVQYIEHIDWDEYLYIIMEYIPGGDLGTLISQRGHLPEMTVKTMAIQLLDALKYLHGLGITHRDVKPDNILIHSFEPFHVKLTDFGLSKMVDSEETFMRTFCGTLLYCAPEVYSEYREYNSEGKRVLRGVDKKSLPPQRYGHAVDIWSLAGVLFYALCGTPPFHVKNATGYQALLNHIMRAALDLRPLQRANVSDNGIRFVRSMLHVRPQFRATIPELEASAWLNSDSMEASVELEEDDQVDMVGDGLADEEEEEIEKGASQLTLDEAQVDDEGGDDGGDDDVENVEDFGSSEITEIQNQLGIPSSFNTSEENSSEGHGVAGKGGRLFGEVDTTAFGSSGALPLTGLNLPVPRLPLPLDPRLISGTTDQSDQTTKSQSVSPSSLDMSQTPGDPRQAQWPAPTASNAMPPPPPPHIAEPAINPAAKDGDRRAERSSSLMGTESLVGHLNMRSATNTPSPAPERLASPVVETQAPTASLRRRRDAEEGVEDWWPAEVPAPKKQKWDRDFDLDLPAQIFWDPKDRSTRHENYPRMKSSQYEAFVEAAAARGEKFVPGEAFFNSTMESFRSSRSPSVEPQITQRAISEPTKDEGRRLLMKRDDRKLGVDAAIQQADRRYPEMPPTARDSGVLTNDPPSPIPAELIDTTPPILLENGKRVLARFRSTPDSCLRGFYVNVVDSITTFGRHPQNTIQYPNKMELRIPKYAMKLLLFKPGFYDNNGNAPKSWDGKDGENQEVAFYISSKATKGVYVNGTHVPSHNHEQPNAESKYWFQLYHMDKIDIWQHDRNSMVHTTIGFECFVGKSRHTRPQSKIGGEYQDLIQEPIAAEMDRICLSKENFVLQEKQLKQIEETERNNRQKGTKYARAIRSAGEQIHRNQSAPPTSAGAQLDVHQSFSGTPSFTQVPATVYKTEPNVDYNQSFAGAPSFIGASTNGGRNGRHVDYNQSFNGAPSLTGADNRESQQLDFNQSFSGAPPFSQ